MKKVLVIFLIFGLIGLFSCQHVGPSPAPFTPVDDGDGKAISDRSMSPAPEPPDHGCPGGHHDGHGHGHGH